MNRVGGSALVIRSLNQSGGVPLDHFHGGGVTSNESGIRFSHNSEAPEETIFSETKNETLPRQRAEGSWKLLFQMKTYRYRFISVLYIRGKLTRSAGFERKERRADVTCALTRLR